MRWWGAWRRGLWMGVISLKRITSQAAASVAGVLEECSSSAVHAELYRCVLDTVEADGSQVDLRAQPGDASD